MLNVFLVLNIFYLFHYPKSFIHRPLSYYLGVVFVRRCVGLGFRRTFHSTCLTSLKYYWPLSYNLGATSVRRCVHLGFHRIFSSVCLASEGDHNHRGHRCSVSVKHRTSLISGGSSCEVGVTTDEINYE